LRKLFIGLALAVLAYQFAIHGSPFWNRAPRADAAVESAIDGGSREASHSSKPVDSRNADASSKDALAQAYEQHRSGVQVESGGVVAKVLSDDNNGSRHQRMVVRLDSGQTVLISHNIDLAPRVETLREGDTISFAGEYEWNDKGGLVHWTHRDPAGHHAAGWLDHEGRRYQ